MDQIRKKVEGKPKMPIKVVHMNDIVLITWGNGNTCIYQWQTGENLGNAIIPQTK